MLSHNLLLLLGFATCAVPAISSSVVSDQIIQLAQPQNITETLNFTNVSTTANLQGRFNVECNGDEYGDDLLVADCNDAIEYLPFESGQWAFADRGTPQVTAETVLLPYRSMGDKGRCYVETSLVPGARIAHANLAQIKTAAEAVMRKCTVGGKLYGGIASNIGGDNKLVIMVGAYNNPVQCRGHFPAWNSCRGLLEDIAARKQKETIGVDVPLPYIVASRDNRCQIRIFSVTGPDTSSGYDIWQALTAIFSVCVRAMKSDSTKGVGEHGRLLISMAPTLDFTGNGSQLAIE